MTIDFQCFTGVQLVKFNTKCCNMHIIVRFALFLIIFGDNKFLSVNCQSSNREGYENSPGCDTDENSMKGVTSKLDSIEAALQSIHVVVNSLKDVMMKQEERIDRLVQTLEDMRQETSGNITAALEIIDGRANKSQEHSHYFVSNHRREISKYGE